MFECDPNDIDKLSATLKTALQIDFVFNYTNLQKTIYKKEAVSKESRTRITQKSANFRKSYTIIIQHNIEY